LAPRFNSDYRLAVSLVAVLLLVLTLVQLVE
jgi:hypothetical protein